MKDLKALPVSASMERFCLGWWLSQLETAHDLGLVDTIHHWIGCSSAIVARYWWGSVSSQGLTEVWRFPFDPKKTLDVAGQTEPQIHGAYGKRGTFNNLLVLMFGSLVWGKWNVYRWLFGEYEPKSLTLPSPQLILNTFKKRKMAGTDSLIISTWHQKGTWTSHTTLRDLRSQKTNMASWKIHHEWRCDVLLRMSKISSNHHLSFSGIYSPVQLTYPLNK